MSLLYLAALLLIVVGVVGTVLPAIPGMPLLLAGVVLFAVGTGFSVIDPPLLALFVLLGLLGMGLNYLGNLFGARRFGASRLALGGAVLGLVAGFFLLGALLGPLAVAVGPVAGATLAELAQGREPRAAFRSGFGVFIGYILGSLAEVVIALMLAGWFLWLTWGAQSGLR
jgi:uncharacterized protein YqgC (DUF456 family)